MSSVPKEAQEPINPPPPEGENLSILGHLNELRIRFTYIGVGVLVATSLSFIFAERILQFLLQPYAASSPSGASLQTLRPTEGIETYFKVSLMAGIILSMPIILYEFWKFIEPGLHKNEKRYIFVFIPSALILFVLGLAFAWFILAPAAIYFLANFMPEVFRTEWTGQEYISFITRLLLWIGVAFQLPVVIYVVARVGLVTPATLKSQWRVAVVAIAVLAAVITPSIDPITMLLTMAPLVVLYLLSIVLAGVGQRQYERATELI
jgi:sec-independent protein translocase protein TatC